MQHQGASQYWKHQNNRQLMAGYGMTDSVWYFASVQESIIGLLRLKGKQYNILGAGMNKFAMKHKTSEYGRKDQKWLKIQHLNLSVEIEIWSLEIDS